MKTLIYKIKNRERKRITVKRIAILGFLLALIIALKYAFGMIAGIEAVSFMFVICGIFLPIVDLSFLIVAFNLMVMAMYGAGTWEIMYWIIWPVDALISKLLTKVTRNRYAFALWGFIAGFSLAFWYFISDYIFFGYSIAALNIITAIPVNLIEGLCTFGLILAVGPQMLRVTSIYAHTFWERDSSYTFKDVKYQKLNLYSSLFLVVASVVGIVLLFVYNGFFIHLKQEHISENIMQFKDINNMDGIPNGWGALTPEQYNNYMHALKPDQVGIAIIANGKHYEENITIHKDETIFDALKDVKTFGFKYDNSSQWGAFVNSFFLKENPNSFLHGLSKEKNYGDYYPFIFVNREFSQLGVSNYLLKPGLIIEFTYDF